MVYKLIVTERAEEQLDECLYYLVYRLGNNIAAEHLLACIEKAYDVAAFRIQAESQAGIAPEGTLAAASALEFKMICGLA